MAIDMALIGNRIINRAKARKGTKSSSSVDFVKKQLLKTEKIKSDIRKVQKIQKKHKKAPKKVTIKNPLIPDILQPIANVTPIGWLKGTTTYKQPLKTGQVLTALGKPGEIGKSTFPIQYGGTEFIFDAIEEPGEMEVQVQPHPIFEDTVKTGSGLDEAGYQEAYKETIGDVQLPGIEPVKLPEIKMPDFSKMFGDIGKYALLGLGAIILISIMGRRK